MARADATGHTERRRGMAGHFSGKRRPHFFVIFIVQLLSTFETKILGFGLVVFPTLIVENALCK